jgi:hypothetical protein
MISKNLVFVVGIISALLLTMTIQLHTVKAAPITLDLKKAKNPGPGFTDEKVGTVSIDSNANKTAISSDVTAKAKPDKAFEGWLVDTGGSNYKLSLGKYDDKGHLQFLEPMVNQYTYKQFIITEEPLNDKDPNAADTYGGADLPNPFGQ